MLIAVLEREILLALDLVALLLDHLDIAIFSIEHALVRKSALEEPKVSHFIWVDEHLAGRALGRALFLCDLESAKTLHNAY